MAPDISRLRMPKNLLTQIHWLSTSLQFTTALANNAITEFNFPFSLGDLPLASSITGLFDQYAIFAVYIRTIINYSTTSAVVSPTYVTAIDYDNVANIGNIATLRTYSTQLTTPIAEVQERYIEPCNAPALYSGSAFTHYGQARMWVDSANNSTPHYGFRCIIQALGAGVTGLAAFECTYVVCARNLV